MIFGEGLQDFLAWPLSNWIGILADEGEIELKPLVDSVMNVNPTDQASGRAVLSPTLSEPKAAEASGPELSAEELELSIVMPCLNEEETLEICLRKAQQALRDSGIKGEVIVADNGSTDRSPEITRRLGARLVPVKAKGYGNALMGGILAARGRYIVMGDADDSYDFLEAPKFLAKLREGFDLVQGCRLPAGGGKVLPGAMPFSHRWLGNPAFSLMARHMFSSKIHDIYCGLRGFSKDLFKRLDLRCTGMEFATEMIIKSSVHGAKIAEIPITLHPDGRVSRPPHLRTIRDGWRTLRFFLLFSPRWLFLHPGVLLLLMGVLGYGVAMPGVRVAGVTFDAHTLLFSSLALMLGYQSVLFAVFAKVFAMSEGLLPPDPRFTRLFTVLNLEKGLLAGVISLGIGAAVLAGAVLQWKAVDFGPLNYSHTMRWVIPGVTLTALGFQTILSSFFISILGMRRR